MLRIIKTRVKLSLSLADSHKSSPHVFNQNHVLKSGHRPCLPVNPVSVADQDMPACMYTGYPACWKDPQLHTVSIPSCYQLSSNFKDKTSLGKHLRNCAQQPKAAHTLPTPHHPLHEALAAKGLVGSYALAVPPEDDVAAAAVNQALHSQTLSCWWLSCAWTSSVSGSESAAAAAAAQ